MRDVNGTPRVIGIADPGQCTVTSQLCCTLSPQSGPTLCDPMDCSPSGCSVHGTLQARILEWVARPLPGDLSDPGIEPPCLRSPELAGGFFITLAAWEAQLPVELVPKNKKVQLLRKGKADQERPCEGGKDSSWSES